MADKLFERKLRLKATPASETLAVMLPVKVSEIGCKST